MMVGDGTQSEPGLYARNASLALQGLHHAVHKHCPVASSNNGQKVAYTRRTHHADRASDTRGSPVTAHDDAERTHRLIPVSRPIVTIGSDSRAVATTRSSITRSSII